MLDNRKKKVQAGLPRALIVFLLVSMSSGQMVARVELTFPRSVAKSSRLQLKTGSISGVITSPNSHAVIGATITALLRDAAATSTQRSFSEVSDREGCFRFKSLPIGTYQIRVGVDEIWLMKPILRQVIVRNDENTTIDLHLQFIDECDANFPEVLLLSDSDRAEIIKWMIEELLKNKKANSDSSDKIVVVSNVNIESRWVPIIPGYKPLVLTPTEVQQRANSHGAYMYWQFDKIRARGSCVAVSLSSLWAVGTGSSDTGQTALLGQKLFNYVFHKESGKWIGKFISGSIS